MNKALEALNDLWHGKKTTETYQIIEKELKAFEIVKEIVNKSISEWGNVDFNINDYPLLKEVLKNE